MDRHRMLAAMLLSTLLAACSASPPASPTVPDSDEPSTLQGQVLSDAEGVANQINQRYDDMESAVP